MKIILRDLFDWCWSNKLPVNIEKTCYTIFKTACTKIPNFLDNVNIGNVTIPIVPSTKYLGVILDANLNWEEHIEYLNKLLIKTGSSFKTKTKIIFTLAAKLFYIAYIYSKIQYGIEVYWRANKTALQKVKNLTEI